MALVSYLWHLFTKPKLQWSLVDDLTILAVMVLTLVAYIGIMIAVAEWRDRRVQRIRSRWRKDGWSPVIYLGRNYTEWRKDGLVGYEYDRRPGVMLVEKWMS